MLSYDLTKKEKVPIYIYLYENIRNDIISGKLKKGEKLPSKRSLARHLNVGVITVAGAYEQLLTEGYIYSIEKSGYYVQDISSYKIADNNKTRIEYKDTPQESFFVDFKANRIGLQQFPIASWNKYMRRTLSESNESLYKTIPYNGIYELRLAISNYLLRARDIEVDPSQIIIGAGTEYLYSRLMQMFGPSCVFAMEDPGYKKFAAISQNHGNLFKYIPIDESGLMIDMLEKSDADLVHVSPANHFPTGIVMPIKRRLELFEWANRAHKRYIIEDDYDSEFRYSGHFIRPMFAEDTEGKVIYMNTFSKSMVPSLRISYMVLPPALVKRYEKSMSFYSCTVSSFEQYALSLFISDGLFERHINRIKNYYGKQRELILKAIKNSALNNIATITERNAGTHFLLKVKTNFSEEEIKKRALNEEISLSMYSDYSYNPDKKYKGTLVINYAGIDPSHIEEIIHRLEKVFKL